MHAASKAASKAHALLTLQPCCICINHRPPDPGRPAGDYHCHGTPAHQHQHDVCPGQVLVWVLGVVVSDLDLNDVFRPVWCCHGECTTGGG